MAKLAKLFKDSVSTFSSLPTSGNVQGDVRIAKDTGFQYYWAVTSGSGSLADWRVINDPVPSPITAKEKEFLEILKQYKLALETFYETYSYTGNQLTTKDVWTDSGLTTKLFSRAFTYTGSKLTSDVVTRISDGATVTRAYTYTGNKLTSKEYT